jgi:hypothetical protein
MLQNTDRRSAADEGWELPVRPQAAIEPDLRLALAKPRFRTPLQF